MMAARRANGGMDSSGQAPNGAHHDHYRRERTPTSCKMDVEERLQAFLKIGFNNDPLLIQMTFGCCENTARNWVEGRSMIEFWRFVTGLEGAPEHVQQAAAATLGLAWVNPEPPARSGPRRTRDALPGSKVAVPEALDRARGNLRRAG